MTKTKGVILLPNLLLSQSSSHQEMVTQASQSLILRILKSSLTPPLILYSYEQILWLYYQRISTIQCLLTVSAAVPQVWPKPPLSCLGCYNRILMLCSSTPGPPQQREGYVESVCQNPPMASYVTQSNEQIPSVFRSRMCLASALTSPKSNKDLSPVTSLSSLVLGLFSGLEWWAMPLPQGLSPCSLSFWNTLSQTYAHLVFTLTLLIFLLHSKVTLSEKPPTINNNPAFLHFWYPLSG